MALRTLSNEMGGLTQGVHPHMLTGTNTIHFIHSSKKITDRKAKYLQIVVELKPHKAEKHRVRFTVGDNRIDYPTAKMWTVKLHLNSVLSDVNASYLVADIKKYLNTPMNKYQYMRIPVEHIPKDVMEQYDLKWLIINIHVLVENCKDIYGLPHAGLIAQKCINAHLLKFGYYKCKYTPMAYDHKTRTITFTFVVDDFGINYNTKEDATHLLNCLRSLYDIIIYCTYTLYIGLTLRWDYIQRIVCLSIPGYIEKALHRFCVSVSPELQHSPHQWIAPVYDTKVQMTIPLDFSHTLGCDGK